MSEKINSELNTEDVFSSVSEDTEKTVVADNDEITAVADNDEITVAADDEAITEAVDNDTENPDISNNEEIVDINAIDEEEKTGKKKLFLQGPVIIACCIVLAAVIGFLAYMAFFLKEPENVTWSEVVNDMTYYYEFKPDGTFTGYLGSIEVSGSFQKADGEDGKTLAVSKTFGSFYQNATANYTISGSRLFGNQELTCSYSDEYTFTLNQSKREKDLLDLPEEFTPDEELIGSWVFKYMGYEIYKVTFNEDGSMVMEFVQDGYKYNGIYTIEDSTINFTYYTNESVVVPLDYSVNGDSLNFMGYGFVREGSEAEKATSDQQLLIPQANDTAESTQAAEAAETTEAE